MQGLQGFKQGKSFCHFEMWCKKGNITFFTWEFGSILERENILQEFSLHLVLLEK
jgi:hypothetical protein